MTKGEKELREKQRTTPVFTENLEPDGSVTRAVNLKAEAENERRIGFIKKRLERMKNLAKRDFHYSR
ncbi:MAG: hypothetical protein P8P30_11095 [Rickettsiales bacterium]|nr:hypothetical protein [Rickettsiales bacterium]